MGIYTVGLDSNLTGNDKLQNKQSSSLRMRSWQYYIIANAQACDWVSQLFCFVLLGSSQLQGTPAPAPHFWDSFTPAPSMVR